MIEPEQFGLESGRNYALESVGATVGVYSCYCGATWLHNKYPNLCPECGGSCLTQSWIEMHDHADDWWGMDSWDYPILVKRGTK